MTDFSQSALDFEASLRDGIEYDAAEELIIQQIKKVLTRIDELDEAQKDLPLLATGSQGQKVISPLVSEARFQRSLLNSLLKRIELPDEEEEDGPMTRSESARLAANARWAVRRG